MRNLQRSVPPLKWLLVLPQLTSRVCHPQANAAEFVTTLLVHTLGVRGVCETGGGGRACMIACP